MHYKALIFDLDGVIADTARLHFKAWKYLADKYGYAFDESVNEGLKGVSRMDSLKIILEHNHTKLCQNKMDALCEEKNAYYVELLQTLSQKDILPAIEDLLFNAKKRGFKIALASSSRNAKTIIDKLGITHYFDYIADASKIRNPKPDPEIFFLCASSLAIPNRQCIAFEDAEAGIKAINSAGMFSVGIGSFKNENPSYNVASTKDLDITKILSNAEFC